MSVERLELCGGRATVYVGDVRAGLAAMPERSVQCCVTSPPYYALRDYGVEGQIGLEETPEAFIAALVEVFRGVRRVLRDDGVCFVNMGDSYSGSTMTGGGAESSTLVGTHHTQIDGGRFSGTRNTPGLKPKDLCGIPWRLAFALQADGWYLRSDIIWAKPNPMPESVTDRPTKSHEYIFLLTKSARYFWDAEGVKEKLITGDNGSRFDSDRKLHIHPNTGRKRMPPIGGIKHAEGNDNPTYSGNTPEYGAGRNIRTVWQIATQAYPGSHFATFPEAIPERCIKAGTSERGCCPECGEPWERIVEKSAYVPEVVAVGVRNVDDSRADKTRKLSGKEYNEQASSKTIGWKAGCECGHEPVPCRVLDPFLGSGTTVAVALKLGRRGVGCELNPKYVELARERIGLAAGPSTYQSNKVVDAPLFACGGNQ